MRVLVLNPGVSFGGAEQSLILLLQGLRERGVDPIVAGFGPGPLQQRLEDLKIRVLQVDVCGVVRRATRYRSAAPHVLMALAFGAPAVARVARIVVNERVDLIHTNGMKAHPLGGIAGRLTGVPVVWHLHDFPPPGLAGRVFRLMSTMLPDVTLACSEALAAEIQTPPHATRRPVIVHNPVDLQRFCPEISGGRIRRELGLDAETLLVGMVAHLTPWKGHMTFLRIAQTVAVAVPNARFVVVGGPIYQTDGHTGYQEHLIRCAARLGIAEKTTFLGLREDIPEILSAIDIVVHCPTSPEPFGRVLAEAMAVARPVVAARCGGIPEVVTDGETGVLVPMGDINGFSTAVVRLLQDSALRTRFGQAGRRRAELVFGLDSYADRVLAAYRAVLGVRRQAA